MRALACRCRRDTLHRRQNGTVVAHQVEFVDGRPGLGSPDSQPGLTSTFSELVWGPTGIDHIAEPLAAGERAGDLYVLRPGDDWRLGNRLGRQLRIRWLRGIAKPDPK